MSFEGFVCGHSMHAVWCSAFHWNPSYERKAGSPARPAIRHSVMIANLRSADSGVLALDNPSIRWTTCDKKISFGEWSILSGPYTSLVNAFLFNLVRMLLHQRPSSVVRSPFTHVKKSCAQYERRA